MYMFPFGRACTSCSVMPNSTPCCSHTHSIIWYGLALIGYSAVVSSKYLSNLLITSYAVTSMPRSVQFASVIIYVPIGRSSYVSFASFSLYVRLMLFPYRVVLVNPSECRKVISNSLDAAVPMLILSISAFCPDIFKDPRKMCASVNATESIVPDILLCNKGCSIAVIKSFDTGYILHLQ